MHSEIGERERNVYIYTHIHAFFVSTSIIMSILPWWAHWSFNLKWLRNIGWDLDHRPRVSTMVWMKKGFAINLGSIAINLGFVFWISLRLLIPCNSWIFIHMHTKCLEVLEKPISGPCVWQKGYCEPHAFLNLVVLCQIEFTIPADTNEVTFKCAYRISGN